MADTKRNQQELFNIFRDGQPANSISAQDVRDLIVSAPYLQTAAWDFHLDGTYTVSNKRAVTAGTRTLITIDGTAGNFGHPLDSGGNHGEFWVHGGGSPEDDFIQPSGLNDFGIVRLAFQGEHTAGAEAHIDVELDVGGGTFPIIWEQTAVMIKGTNNPQWFNFTIPLFSGPDFQTNGGRLYITPSQNCNFWNFAFTGARIYAASAAGNPGTII
jgi:hypothetical protein